MGSGRLRAIPSAGNVDLLQTLEGAGMVARAQAAEIGRLQLAIRGIFSLLVVGMVISLAAWENPKSQAAAPVTPVTTILSPAPPSADVYLASGLIVVENQLDVAALRDGVISRIAADTGKLVHK